MEYDRLTGQSYDRARAFNSSRGEFMNLDPLGFAAGSANLYSYVGNDATNAVDPAGLEPPDGGTQQGRGGAGTYFGNVSRAPSNARQAARMPELKKRQVSEAQTVQDIKMIDAGYGGKVPGYAAALKRLQAIRAADVQLQNELQQWQNRLQGLIQRVIASGDVVRQLEAEKLLKEINVELAKANKSVGILRATLAKADAAQAKQNAAKQSEAEWGLRQLQGGGMGGVGGGMGGMGGMM